MKIKIKIKPRTYYKLLYNNGSYDIIYTGTKCAYLIAYKLGNQPLVKYNKKFKWKTIRGWQEYIKRCNIKTKIMSKGDLFLELL